MEEKKEGMERRRKTENRRKKKNIKKESDVEITLRTGGEGDKGDEFN
jgi:hypothetical protein